MPTKLNVLPPRVPIGTFTDQFGKSHDILPSPELTRSLADLMKRVGGPTAFSSDELLALTSTDPGDSSALAVLQNKVLEQAAELASFAGTAARLASLERKLEDLARLAYAAVPAPVDWEHPGRLGEKTPNSARVTTLNRIRFTQPATLATFTLADGKTLTVTNSIALAGADGKTLTLSNTLGFSGTDGAFLNIGAGGTLGSAAYASASAFASRSTTALAPVATDAASTQLLSNSIRAVLVSVGVGT